MKRTLVIHHLEPMWEQGYKSFGTSFERLCMEVAEHLESNEYDRIFLTRFESNYLDDAFEYSYLERFFIDVFEYGYGWELSGFLDDEESEKIDEINQRLDTGEIITLKWNTKVARGGTHSEIVLIEDWMESLKGDEVYICGAFDGECVEDLETALDALKIEYKRIEDLII